MILLFIVGFPDSLVNFRVPLLDALLSRELSVHVAAPDLPDDCQLRHQCEEKGLHISDIPLRRTGYESTHEPDCAAALVGCADGLEDQ